MADADVNGLVEQAQGLATESNVALATEVGSDFLSLALKLLNDAALLLQENVWWGLIILVLMKAEDMVIDHFGLPIPGGKVRWVALFFFTLFFSFVWINFFAGFLP